MSERFFGQILENPGPGQAIPKFGEFFSVHNVERKFLGRGTAFGRNQGVVGSESIPKTVAVVVKGFQGLHCKPLLAEHHLHTIHYSTTGLLGFFRLGFSI